MQRKSYHGTSDKELPLRVSSYLDAQHHCRVTKAVIFTCPEFRVR